MTHKNFAEHFYINNEYLTVLEISDKYNMDVQLIYRRIYKLPSDTTDYSILLDERYWDEVRRGAYKHNIPYQDGFISVNKAHLIMGVSRKEIEKRVADNIEEVCNEEYWLIGKDEVVSKPMQVKPSVNDFLYKR